MPYTLDYGTFQGRGAVTLKTMEIARTIMSEPGLTYRQIAKQFGVNYRRVGHIARRMGVARRRRIDDIQD
jgi:DNA-binding CsgD family transcriptional regulator|tara:strand:+ start:597 stop:806 length:210 start_codon:yes stop_codon:yes gene_type:complete